MLNPRRPYDGLITEQDMLTLIENTNKTPNLEWDEYTNGEDNVSYPMWKIANPCNTYEEWLDYFDAKRKSQTEPVVADDQKVGIVKPSDAFDNEDNEVEPLTESVTKNGLVFGGEDLADKVARLMNKGHVLSDKTGAVKPKSEGMPSKTTEQITNVDNTKKSEPEMDAAKKNAKPAPGFIKPSADLGTQTKVDVFAGKGLTKGDHELSDKTGVVKPKSEGMPSKTATQVTDHDTTKDHEPEIERAAAAVKPTPGFIKPKGGDLANKATGITFKEYLGK